MSKLFESTEINGMKTANRFVRSATWEGMATEEGACTPRLADLMTQLAKGEVGLIITSHAYVRRDGQAGVSQLGIYEDSLVQGLREMTEAVHDQNGHVVLQIAHGGLFANAKLTGQDPLTPSHAAGLPDAPCRQMTSGDIRDLTEAFGQAAFRAREAGFDGVQIHSAHGYLLSEFLSPAFNERTDNYGGPVENRARFLLDVLRCIRKEVGNDFPILIKMNTGDFQDHGLTLADSLKIGVMLQENGIDAIELSGGTPMSGKLGPVRRGIQSEEKEAYFKEAGKAFKEELDVPIILVGGIRTFQLAEQLVENGYADYISMSRPFIREPGLVKRWASGDLRKAMCLSDNQCFGSVRSGEGIYCVVERKEEGKAG